VNGTPREWIVFDDGGSWRLAGSDYRPHEWAHRIYQGPCLTPAEVDARIATARKDALEEAARVADGYHQRAIEWAYTVRGLEKHIDATDSSRIATDSRALAKGEGDE
jgi:hypothetical protein